MTFKEIQDLIKQINRSNLAEFRMREGDFELTIRTNKYQKGKAAPAPTQQIIPLSAAPTPTPAQIAATPAPAPAAAPVTKKESQPKEEKKDYLEIKSPMVGTFYRSPSPEKGPYVKVGDQVTAGDTVCIVEAMKLFNEIESEISGKIVKVMVEDAQPVEYDQVLFLVEG